jgi:hypothetical protein
MARSRFCRICREFHDIEAAWPAECVGHFGAVADGHGPNIISDTIAPFQSMADGRMYDSKSQYRRDLKSRGLVEAGNEQVKQQRREAPPVRDTLRQVRQQLWG